MTLQRGLPHQLVERATHPYSLASWQAFPPPVVDAMVYYPVAPLGWKDTHYLSGWECWLPAAETRDAVQAAAFAKRSHFTQVYAPNLEVAASSDWSCWDAHAQCPGLS